MPTGTALTPPTQALPDTPAPKRTLGLPDLQLKQMSPTHSVELLFSPPVSHTATPSIYLQSTTDHNYDAISAVPQCGEAEDEYTLSAYGDISLSEIIIPPLPAPAHPSPGPLQPKFPQPRLRLKVRRPPMPKRRLSYIYIEDSLPQSGGMNPDERWPGSPRPVTNSPPWLQHQPLVSPLPMDTTTSRTQRNKPVENGGSSLENFFDELVPRSPSIRLSPPGSPASQALSLPQSLPTPATQQDKPREAAWRTKLPPRLPIPKWDM